MRERVYSKYSSYHRITTHVKEESKTKINKVALWLYVHKDAITKYTAPCKVFILPWKSLTLTLQGSIPLTVMYSR